ncbi:MAG: glycosyltransferase [Humidesulfovibrio sp.]
MPARPDSPSPGQTRPVRAGILDELGLAKSLSAAPGDFRTLCGPDGSKTSPDTLFLGLGPEPERLPELFPDLGAVRYAECPELAAQLGDGWRGRIPAAFAKAKAEDITALARSGARIVLYTPGPRVFPGFWGPLLARLQVALFAVAPAPRRRLAWLPGNEAGLLRIELREALETLGWTVRLTGDAGLEDCRALLAGGECPELFLSVNFSGLDPLGEACHLLQAAGARVAVWCVDNPLHLLSGLKSRFWTALPLFVTDGWFVDALRKLGAAQVFPLPLAARARDLDSPARTPSPAWAELSERLVFAGRSAFPGRAGFFAGCALPDTIWPEAQAMLERGRRPDFGWWLERLRIDRLWPGAEVRRAGFCAEETGRAWRTLCLRRAQSDLGLLTVFGDAGWRELLPETADLRGVVDYYTALPDIAASAGCCLGLTSPLLPRGLSQRHFDTWAWGGLLLSDATPGLDIFPAELTREITFRAPQDLAPRIRALTGSPALAADLKAAWRAELSRAHTYGHRLAEVLERLGLSG